MRKHGLLAVVFFLGILAGMLGTLWFGPARQVGPLFTLLYLGFESDEATEQYIGGHNKDVAIYALEHLLRFNEAFLDTVIGNTRKEPRLLEKHRPMDFVFASVRLGNLYLEKGQDAKAQTLYTRALEVSVKSGLFAGKEGTSEAIKGIEDLKNFVAKADERLRANPRETPAGGR